MVEEQSRTLAHGRSCFLPAGCPERPSHEIAPESSTRPPEAPPFAKSLRIALLLAEVIDGRLVVTDEPGHRVDEPASLALVHVVKTIRTPAGDIPERWGTLASLPAATSPGCPSPGRGWNGGRWRH